MAVLIVCFMCAATFAHAQRVLPLYTQKDLPLPQDSVQRRIMTLTSADMQLKAQAEDFLKHENLDRAVEILKGVSNQWVSHWFLSYAYESQRRYREALGEVGWLRDQSQRKDLTIELIEREKMLERAIQEMEEQPPPPSKPQKSLILG
jgi:hypothetical protein